MTDTPDVARLLDNARALADSTEPAVAEIEAMVIETVSAFEARLQHNFARGPFFVKLRNKLAAEGHIDLAQTVYHYYLAANVLKHGGGKSLRELEKIEPQPFTLQDEEGKALIDVTADGFLSGLVEALEKSHQALAAK
ncbi:hypothetical protein [Sulfitobacter guttiformis]|uniref:Uncharacterized protein n=1 Tax=Sulfitobacter guttiformis TaxID=74349 RepID=A0A420DSV0_9RHOB|nr:hypothetical protein [Sulfitobacter guttiformis]KIN74749.1 hypothetical protein Z949_3948 [Sulfitobacter guttiformis KCTC 32187]RKE97322.1 hypothetical protein C8N30_1919 [Sulfitobacter guttiformis]